MWQQGSGMFDISRETAERPSQGPNHPFQPSYSFSPASVLLLIRILPLFTDKAVQASANGEDVKM